MEQKAEDQRYLTRQENQVLLANIKTRLQATGCIHAREVRTIATEIRSRRPRSIHSDAVSQQTKPPGRNWATSFLQTYCNDLHVRNSQGLGWLKVIADFIAMPAEVEQLCSECASIDLRLETVLSRQPNISRKIHTFKHLLNNIEQASCKLCKFVLDCATSWNWPATDKLSLHIHHMNTVFGPNLAGGKIALSLSIEDKSLKKSYQGWIVPTQLQTDASKVTGLVWGHLGKTADCDKMMEWLKFCDQHHLTDCRMPEPDKIPLFWLIDCATRCIVNAPDQVEYVALSYCWGLPSGKPLDNPSELPAVASLVIEDALKVTRALGIPYLWVDRYCISQSDRSIQPTQLQNMHKVYRSAYVTIVDGSGDDPDYGLPGVSTRIRKPQAFVNTHGHRLECVPDIEQEIQSSRWSTRGWTYQENLLSKRRLVFTRSQTYFQCWNMHCSEATPICLEEAHTNSMERFKESIHTLRVFPRKGIGKTSNEIEARIQEYLGRDLTWDSDALKAFLGIYQAFRELDYPVYNFWGLPISKDRTTKRIDHDPSATGDLGELYNSFLSSLGWSMSSCDDASTHLLTRRDMFPSWTWAAWKGLAAFSRKHITANTYSPLVSFRTNEGRPIGLEGFEKALGPSDSSVIFEPCIYLDGWTTNIQLVQEDCDGNSIPNFQVVQPVPTHRVAVITTETGTHLKEQVLSELFQVLLLGSESGCESDTVAAPPGSLKNVHAIILQAGPNGTHTRLGVVTWSRLGHPTFDEGHTIMRVNELFEARRIVPPCRCGCTSSNAAPFIKYLEDPHHVLEFRKARIRLV
jgi:hypothetical protein